MSMRVGGLIVLLVLRVLWLSAYPMNSDEPQHAHVAWSIAQGAMPYRDVFDNHGPLFSAIYAALLKILGERPDILWWLRLAVVPWYMLSLVATWRIARRLYSNGIADAAAILIGLLPILFIKFGEFRTDDLWAALWLCGMATMTLAQRRIWRWLASGVLFGAALSVSQKTLPLTVVALASAGAIWGAWWWTHRRVTAANALALLAGMVTVPGLFVLWLAMRHDGAPAWFDIVSYNLAPTGCPGRPWHLAGYALVAVAILAFVVVTMRGKDATTRWRTFLGVHALLFMLMIWFVWPLPTEQDFLPVLPMAVLWLIGFVDRSGVLPSKGKIALVSLLALTEFGLVLTHAPLWRDKLAAEEAQLRVVIACTTPNDTLMDPKNGGIFRRRPYYLVIESLARQRFKYGRMPDDIAGWLIANHTMVAIDGMYPPAAQAFIEQHYLPGTGGARMAGIAVPALAGPTNVDVALAGNYVATDGLQEMPVSIDGATAATRWSLAAGHHTVSAATGRPLMMVWRQAWECGWRPDVVQSPASGHALPVPRA
ncbi:ArnT family glycosyltransferase [Luteibacter sp. UNCMF366Tsu5.1]|uniref:ArnT family glycosyltransferase n=1 Tax=Luteibacter sp. UNCMF366Tsu5.1 TaxID=1502758 RepID=UPI0009091319|nr:glycosyltransferase family 39 protein [Luteibacter sp. UNCMF366Tsu5.1]SFW25337.1 Dolichyl-phosphate-mannose-protein mannosyltransferase [Luteibacter sp. UNCMF366Tsu5.1]